MKKGITITVMILSILLVGLYMVTSTYAVIIEVTKKDGALEIINDITVKDVLSNNDGTYNDTYYMIKDELDISDKDAKNLLEAKSLDEALQKVLKSIVEYKVNNNEESKLSNEEIYNLIANAVLKVNNIDDDLKSRIINKASLYKKDVSKYIYDIEVSLLGDTLWEYT